MAVNYTQVLHYEVLDNMSSKVLLQICNNLKSKLFFLPQLQVISSLYHAARVNVSLNAFFSSRSEKTFSLTLILCGKKQIEMCFFVVCTLINNEYASLLFSQAFFPNCFCLLSEFAKVFEAEKSDAYKQLICIMQRVHFQIRVGVYNCHDKDFVSLILW